MTGQNEPDRQDRWKALGIRTDIPHPARVYDYRGIRLSQLL